VTGVIAVDPLAPDPVAIARASALLRAGGLVAFPTETVYGLGVHALDVAAVRRLFAVKGRPAADPLIVHVTSIEAATPLVTVVPEAARRLAARFWPGPLTLVMPRSSDVPEAVTAGLSSVAIRVPAHPVARALLASSGIPIAAPSANLFSRPSPTHASHVIEDLDGLIDVVLDAGPTTVGVESTVLDLTVDPPVILRPGAVTLEQLRDVVAGTRMRVNAVLSPSAPMPSPGMLERHYSPRAPLTLYEGSSAAVTAWILEDARNARNSGARVGILCADEDREGLADAGSGIGTIELGSVSNLAGVAARLYAALREMDRSGVDLILVRGFPSEDGLGAAIQDRLRRAAAGRIVSVGTGRESDRLTSRAGEPAPTLPRSGRAG
jgi:L-threonylcarbamoyladenylate synthase